MVSQSGTDDRFIATVLLISISLTRVLLKDVSGKEAAPLIKVRGTSKSTATYIHGEKVVAEYDLEGFGLGVDVACSFNDHPTHGLFWLVISVADIESVSSLMLLLLLLFSSFVSEGAGSSEAFGYCRYRIYFSDVLLVAMWLYFEIWDLHR